jgi:hypothetical protein
MMPFGLKNAGATYQRMMSQVFKEQIGRILEVYIYDMIVKTPEDKDPVVDLRETFQQLRRYDLRLIGRVAALTRFLPDSARKCLPFSGPYDVKKTPNGMQIAKKLSGS